MTELDLYQLFKNVIAASATMKGNFFVADGGGNDLNTSNLNNTGESTLEAMLNGKQYPIAMLMPPIELVNGYVTGWSTFKLQLYFINQSYNKPGEIKNMNPDTNTSEHFVQQDWQEMNIEAKRFRKLLNGVILRRALSNEVRYNDKSVDSIRRLSLQNNDKLSGVVCEFELGLSFSPQCEVSKSDIDAITIPGR